MLLRLYIVGNTPQSITTMSNVKQACHELKGKCRVDVIDLSKDPKMAMEDHIFAIPTLVKISPGPIRQLIGTISSKEKVISFLDKY